MEEKIITERQRRIQAYLVEHPRSSVPEIAKGVNTAKRISNQNRNA